MASRASSLPNSSADFVATSSPKASMRATRSWLSSPLALAQTLRVRLAEVG